MKKIVSLTVVFFLFTVSIIAQKSSSNTYDIRLLGKEVNNEYSNFGTSYYGSDKVVFSSPKKRNYIIRNVWNPNNQPYLDLYVGEVSSDGSLTSVEKFSSTLNSKYHEAQVCFTKDLSRVYFTRNNYFKGRYTADESGVNRLQLFTASVDSNGVWSDVQPLPFNSDEYSTGHPALSSDGSVLYFVSDRPGGLGGTDIYKVSVKGNNEYGTPENLGNSINTSGDDMFPYVDGKDFYYSTDGKSDGKGGLDLYISELSEEGVLGAPKNLTNLNSSSDDFAFIIDGKSRTGYFSSNRDGGHGDDDIYFFKELKKEEPKPLKCTYTFVVKNKLTGALLSDSKVVIKQGNSIKNEGVTDGQGRYVYTEDCVKDAKYTVSASKRPVYSRSEVVTDAYSKDNLSPSYEILLSEEFKRTEKGKIVIKINPIYFDYNKSTIRDDAKPELDKVVEAMVKYPKIRIEAGSHTDSRGRNSYNQRLSERRAKSTVDYITSRGVASERISYRGYGETQLVNHCKDGVKCSKEEHQLNRRTEFVIVNPEVLEE